MNSKNPALNSELTKKRIEAGIVRDLTAKGLTLSTGPSDLNIRYHFGSARKTEVETYPAGWRGWGTRVVRVPYTEGTLVIDLRDSGTHSLVWRGIAREDKGDANKIEKPANSTTWSRSRSDKYPAQAEIALLPHQIDAGDRPRSRTPLAHHLALRIDLDDPPPGVVVDQHSAIRQ